MKMKVKKTIKIKKEINYKDDEENVSEKDYTQK